jgi:hypothetical protein
MSGTQVIQISALMSVAQLFRISARLPAHHTAYSCFCPVACQPHLSRISGVRVDTIVNRRQASSQLLVHVASCAAAAAGGLSCRRLGCRVACGTCGCQT